MGRRRKLSEAQEQEVMLLYGTSMTLEQIGARFNVDVGTVWRCIDRSGCPKRPRIADPRPRVEVPREERRRRSRRTMRKYRYGITDEDFQRLFDSQNGACAVCLTATALVVDHDHDTGAVRGLLCTPCNHALGKMKDSIPSLERAAAYLRRAQSLPARPKYAGRR